MRPDRVRMPPAAFDQHLLVALGEGAWLIALRANGVAAVALLAVD
jgi:hypothetical protein